MKEINIVVNGVCGVNGYKIKNIEGGFGEGKKCISVKDIANIHNKKVYKINEIINNNKNRFIEGKDYIDLLNSEDENLRSVADELNMTNSNRVNNAYILSERGYFKLIKLMNNDKAWDIYEELLDNYFDMRKDLKDQKKFYEKKLLKLHF